MPRRAETSAHQFGVPASAGSFFRFRHCEKPFCGDGAIPNSAHQRRGCFAAARRPLALSRNMCDPNQLREKNQHGFRRFHGFERTTSEQLVKSVWEFLLTKALVPVETGIRDLKSVPFWPFPEIRQSGSCRRRPDRIGRFSPGHRNRAVPYAKVSRAVILSIPESRSPQPAA